MKNKKYIASAMLAAMLAVLILASLGYYVGYNTGIQKLVIYASPPQVLVCEYTNNNFTFKGECNLLYQIIDVDRMRKNIQDDNDRQKQWAQLQDAQKSFEQMKSNFTSNGVKT